MGAAGQVWSVVVGLETAAAVLTLFLSCFYFQYLPSDLRYTPIFYTYLLSTLQLFPHHGVAVALNCFSTCPLSLLQLILNQRPLHCVISLPLMPLTPYPILFSCTFFF